MIDAALVARAKALAPELARSTVQTEAVREVPAATIAAYRDAGFLRVLQPKKFGGLQGSFGTFSRIVEELARGCSSSAWVYAVLGEHQWVTACFPEQAQADVWGDDPDAVMSSSLVPRATAARVAGGWRLSGSFPFSSGSLHARWAIIGAFVDDADGVRRIWYFLVPRAETGRVDDWHVLGLRGTGSQTLTLDNAFIPAHRGVTLDALNSGNVPGRDAHPDYPLLAAPRDFLVPFSLPSVMMALGHRAMAIVAPMLRDKVIRASVRLAESDHVQVQLAEAAARLDAAQLLFDARRDWAIGKVDSGQRITDADRLLAKRDVVFAERQVRQAVESLCELAGTATVYDSHQLQAVLRDVLTISTHGVANWQLAMAPYGRMMLQG